MKIANRPRVVAAELAISRVSPTGIGERLHTLRPPHLQNLTADALGVLHSWAVALAATIATARDLAAASEAEAERIKDRRHTVSQEVPRLLAFYLDGGQTRDQAIRTVARLTGIEDAAIELFVSRAARAVQKKGTEQRNHEVMRLYRQGIANAEIGRRVSPDRPLHAKSIARIVSTALRAAAVKIPR
jgi:hypothetical protein